MSEHVGEEEEDQERRWRGVGGSRWRPVGEDDYELRYISIHFGHGPS
jgi:hypothetical protein